MVAKLRKETPNQKRILECSLVSLHNRLEDIDLIGVIYEYMTNRFYEYDKEGMTTYGEAAMILFFDKVKEQTGIDICNEVKEFMRYIKTLYVIDMRGSPFICTSKPLVVVDCTGKAAVDNKFDALFLLEEMYKFSRLNREERIKIFKGE